MPAGNYLLFVHYSGNGYVFFNSVNDQTFQVNLGTVSATNSVTTSFAGGVNLSLSATNGGF